VLIGQAYAANNIKKFDATILSSMILVNILMLLVAIFYVVFPSYLINVYLETVHYNNVIIDLTRSLLAITAISLFFDGTRNVLSGVYRGLQQTKMPMLLSTSALWLISIPLAYLFGFVFGYGARGIRLGFTIGITIGCLMLLSRWLASTKKKTFNMQLGAT